MRYLFYILLIVIIILTITQKRKIRKDELCKESLFSQMVFKKCTPRDFLLDKNLQEKI